MGSIPGQDQPPASATPEGAPAQGYKLTFGTKVAYGLGSIASGTASQGLSAFVLLFFNQVMGLRADWVGFAIMLALIADAFWDPFVGQWSDNTRSRWGRRHPFMYAAALPAAIAFFFLWNPPLGMSDEALFGYLLTLLITTRFAMSFYDVPSAALSPELAPVYDDRAGLFAYRYFFAIAGGLALVIVAYTYLLPSGAAQGEVGNDSTALLNVEGFGKYGLLGAVVIFVSIIAATLGTHDKIKYLHRPPAARLNLRETFAQILETVWNRSLIVLTISGLISGIAAGLSSGLSAYFGLYYWALPPAHLPYLIVAGTLASIFAVGLAPHLARRFDKKPAVMILMWGSLVLGTAPMVARMMHVAPPNGSNELLTILVVVSFFSSAMSTMAIIIISSMVADIAEDSQAKTGRRSEGLLFSADNILQKSISGAGVFFSGVLLAAVNFPDNASPATLDPTVLENLALVYVPVTTVLYAAAIGCVYFFPITRERHAENLQRIEALKTGK